MNMFFCVFFAHSGGKITDIGKGDQSVFSNIEFALLLAWLIKVFLTSVKLFSIFAKVIVTVPVELLIEVELEPCL